MTRAQRARQITNYFALTAGPPRKISPPLLTSLAHAIFSVSSCIFTSFWYRPCDLLRRLTTIYFTFRDTHKTKSHFSARHAFSTLFSLPYSRSSRNRNRAFDRHHARDRRPTEKRSPDRSSIEKFETSHR